MSDSSSGTKEPSDFDLSSQSPKQGSGHSQYEGDLVDLESIFASSTSSPQLPPKRLASLSPPKGSVAPDKDLLLQFDSLMSPSDSSNLEPPLIDIGATESYHNPTAASSSSSNGDTVHSDAFTTPPSSPTWRTNKTLTPIKPSPSVRSPAGSPAKPSPPTCHPDIPEDTIQKPKVPPRFKPPSLSHQSSYKAPPLPDNDYVEQEFVTAPDNYIVPMECSAPTRMAEPADTISNTPLSPPDTISNTPLSPADTISNTPPSPPDTISNTLLSPPDTISNTPPFQPDTISNTPPFQPDTISNTPLSPADTISNTPPSPPDTISKTPLSPPDTISNTPLSPADTISNTPPSPPDTSDAAQTTGTMLLIHEMEDSTSSEKLKQHFSCYRASIHSVELVQDPANSDLKMGVVKFLAPMQAQKLQQEFQQLPLSGRTHKISIATCEIPGSLPPLCSPQFSDEPEARSSVMEGAPIPKERRRRPVSPTSQEFSPHQGSRADTQRVPKNRIQGRTPNKFPRIDPHPHPDDASPPVHAVMIRNIPKYHNTNGIREFVQRWWGNQVISIKSVPDRKNDQNILLYINVHSGDLPDVIANNLLKEGLVVSPMTAEARYNTTLNAPKEPPKPKFQRDMSPVRQDISPRGPGQQNHSLPPNFAEDSPHMDTDPPRQDCTQEERTVLILDQVPPPVNDETMCEYFRDYLEHTWTWDSTPVGENLYSVVIEFSSRQAASQAMDNLAHIPFNGGNVLFSFEGTTPLISNPPPQDPITESPQDYLIISGIDGDATAEEFEHDTFLNRYKKFYSDLRVQTNQKTKQKRIRVSFHSRDAIIEAECALLQCNFRGRKVDVKIEKIKQEQSPPKQEQSPPKQEQSPPKREQTPPKQEYYPPSPVRPPRPSRRSVTSNECIVIVMSIPPNTDNSDVARLFCPFGNIIRNIELKPMDQNANLFQCKVVFDNPESAYNAVNEKDRLTYKGHILDVKLLSELIQTETEPVQTEVACTEVEPTPPATISKKISTELMMYAKTKLKPDFDGFKSEGSVDFDKEKEVLTLTHPDPQALRRFEETLLQEIDEFTEDLDKADVKILNSPCPNYSTCIDMLVGNLKETKQIDYMMSIFPHQIHIFGDKLSVSVVMKKIKQTLYSQLAIECKFPHVLYKDTSQIEVSDLVVSIKSTSIESCKAIRDSMQQVVSSCCSQPLKMSLKYLKPAHVFITRNDLQVCLLIQTPDGKFMDQAKKTIQGAVGYICGLKKHVDSLVPVLDEPIEERLSISQKAIKKLTKSTEKGIILLEKFEAKSKVCISLERQTIIISGFIREDVVAMVEEVQKKCEDVNIVLKEDCLKELQKLYMLKGQTQDPAITSQIIQDLECDFQVKVEMQGSQIALSGDQDSLLNCENNPQLLCEFFHQRLPIKAFHKVVDRELADHFMELIFAYLEDLNSQERFFIFLIKKPHMMENRPGSSDIQILITADMSIMALIEPKIKEIRAKSEFVKLNREDINLVSNAAAGKLNCLSKSEYFHVIHEKDALRLRVLSIGISARSAKDLIDAALSDQTDSRELPINQNLAFYIREKKILHSLTSKYQCDLKVVEVKENLNFHTCIRMNGKRDSIDKVTSSIDSIDKSLVSKAIEFKFPSRKFCSQYHKEILEVINSIKGESDILIDKREITGKDPTSIKECSVNFISTSNPELHQISKSFSELIKFEQSAPKPLTEVQHKKFVAEMLSKFSQLSLDRHYYLDLSREKVIIRAIHYFAKTAIPCGEQDILPYLEIFDCTYRAENSIIFNLLNNQPSREKLHSLGVGNSVDIRPPGSADQPFKLEGKRDNVQFVLSEIKKYVSQLEGYLGTCEVAVHCPLTVLQSDPNILRFLSDLSKPDINMQYKFLSQSLDTGAQSLIASYEYALDMQIITIELRKGDITTLKVDGIVNAANDNLDHCGGVALAISKAGGPIIQQSSTDYVKKHGKVLVSNNVILPPGHLSCQGVIHAVGPIWNSTYPNQVMNELGSCVYNICQQANDAGYASIAIPTISAGIFAFPLNVSTSIIIEAITMFFKTKPFFSLQKLILIDIQDAALLQFQNLCNEKFKISPNTNVSKNPPLPLQKKSSLHTSQPIFEWQENDDSWRPYSEADHNKIRSAYHANPKGTVKTSRNKYTYTIDFVSMVQNNDQTQAKRNIRMTSSSPATQTGPATASSASSWTEIASEKIQFYGPRDKLELTEQKFNELIKSLISKTEFPVTCQMSDLIRIMNSCKTDYAKFDIDETDQDVCKVLIEGYNKEVVECERNITAELLKLLQVQNPQIDQIPKQWDPQGPNEMCKLVKLPPTSQEYIDVLTKFQSTLPNATIQSIERIQNTWLWTRYQQDKERIIQKSTSGANEITAYHGTSNNNPVMVYKGAQGFDHRFSRAGMWGMANYFAVNASYSNSYAHALSDGSKQMFSVKICAGDVIDLPSDGKLRLPPPKNADQSSVLLPVVQPSASIHSQFMTSLPPSIPTVSDSSPQDSVAPQFADDRYDTVSGNTGGSKVYMIYENGRAYPEYLITYR